jgi:hypothetical protein
MTPNVFQRNVAILTLPLLITAIAAPGGNKAYQIRTEAVQKLRAPRPTIKLDGQFNLVFFAISVEDDHNQQKQCFFCLWTITD